MAEIVLFSIKNTDFVRKVFEIIWQIYVSQKMIVNENALTSNKIVESFSVKTVRYYNLQ